jgi:hypothetical protein
MPPPQQGHPWTPRLEVILFLHLSTQLRKSWGPCWLLLKGQNLAGIDIPSGSSSVSGHLKEELPKPEIPSRAGIKPSPDQRSNPTSSGKPPGLS